MKYDIIIVGFGTAGAMAAIAAGRTGRSVLVLEKTTYSGGLQTGGMITEYCNQKAEGLAAEMEVEVMQFMQTGDYASCIAAKKFVLEKNAVNAGVKIHYDVVVKDVLMNGNTVNGVIWLEDGTEYRAESAILIDATADAVISELAGCEFQQGRESDGMYQHSSVIYEVLKDDGRYHYSGTSIRINQEDISGFSRASLDADVKMLTEKNRLTAPSDRAGIREGRHIVPETVYTMNDFVLDLKKITEPITYAYSQFDTNVTDVMLESENFQDWMIASGLWGTKIWFAAPLKTIFPKEVKGLMVAGRHLGVDHDTGHALRMNAAMSCVGEAAGLIAAESVNRNISPDELPYEDVKQLLSLEESPLHENECVWGLSDEEIAETMATDTPGNGIWSAYRQKKTELLYHCLNGSEPESLMYCHAVFALALLKDDKAIPLLRDIAKQRDNRLQCSKAFDFGAGAPAISVPHGCIAIYLLGRFRDSGAIDLLETILVDNNIEYQAEYDAYAVAALLKIGDSHAACRRRIEDILSYRLSDRNWKIMLRIIKYLPETYDAAPHFSEITKNKILQWKHS